MPVIITASSSKSELYTKDVIVITTTGESLPTRERILQVCVRLFLEQGYRKTTVSDITRLANVSNSSFQHFFRAKDGVLTELVRFMFGNQFGIARLTAGETLPPVYTYAVETAVQITLTELNENLREIYLEAYSHDDALNFIHQSTARELYHIFSPSLPALTERDFYILDIGTAGLMRGYMARPCDSDFPLEDKLRGFLSSGLRVFQVPEEELQQIIAFVLSLDIRSLSRKVMASLFASLAMHYNFPVSDILPKDISSHPQPDSAQ